MIIPLNPESLSLPITISSLTFDLEGTLVDLEPLHHSTHQQACAQFGFNKSVSELIHLFPHLIGGPGEEIAKEAVTHFSSPVTPEKYRNTQRAIFDSKFWNLKTIHPRPGVDKFLKYLKRLNIPLSVGSLTEKSRAEFILNKSGLLPYFSIIVLKEDVSALKPAPDVYLATAAKLGINPTSQLVFEDSPHGTESAHTAGSPSIAVPTYHTPEIISRFHSPSTLAIFTTWNLLHSSIRFEK